MTQEKTKIQDYRVFDISTGYAETASIGSVTFVNTKGFNTVLEGLYDLGDSIRKSIEETHRWHNEQVQERIEQKRFRDCCEATLVSNPSRILCAHCLMPVRKHTEPVTAAMVMDEINSMIRSTNDEYGYEIIQCLEEYGWSPYDSMGVMRSPHLRVQVESFKWNPNLLSDRHNRRSMLEWKVYEVRCLSKDYEQHPGYDIDATDGLGAEEDE